MDKCNLECIFGGIYKLFKRDEFVIIEEENKIDRSEYILMVGLLLYVLILIRLDILYSVGLLFRYMYNLGL